MDLPAQVAEATQTQEEIFDRFLERMENALSDEDKVELVRWLSNTISETIDDPSLYEQANDEQYARNIILKEDDGWEVILVCWKKGLESSIHGHPYICSYNFLFGEFDLEIYQKDKDGNISLINEVFVDQQRILIDIGTPNTFDNHIHKVKCLSDLGYSLHIYSDDARKGEEY